MGPLICKRAKLHSLMVWPTGFSVWIVGPTASLTDPRVTAHKRWSHHTRCDATVIPCFAVFTHHFRLEKFIKGRADLLFFFLTIWLMWAVGPPLVKPQAGELAHLSGAEPQETAVFQSSLPTLVQMWAHYSERSHQTHKTLGNRSKLSPYVPYDVHRAHP